MTVRSAIRAAFLLFALFAAAAAPAQRVSSARIGENIDWSYAREPTPVRYRVGEVELTIGGEPDRESPDLILPVLTVAMPGFAPVRVEGVPTAGMFEHRVTVGRWDAGRPFVQFQSFSGGAHCCNQVQIVYPEKDRLRLVELGEWDGGVRDDLPTDVDGDGRLDFEFVDNAFLYTFASYAESWAPPVVIDVVDGEVVDVSAEPRFRRVYEAFLPRVREACAGRDDGASPNGACPAYVAAAARLGRFDEAWADMLRAYDRDSEWPLPPGCKVASRDEPCPEGQEIPFDSYPDALRQFLVEQGYIHT